MKIYISADIEGTTGIAHWDEATKSKPDYQEFQKQMTAEVAAACEGAIEAGADEIYVKDAHDTGRNIMAAKLPERVKLIREWAGNPYSMMHGLDKSFDAVMMTGYHSRAGSDGNPLAHTYTGSVAYLKINERYASEFMIGGYAAAYLGVPVVMITGDSKLCDDAKELNPNIKTVAVNVATGGSVTSIHPGVAIDTIKKTAREALSGDLKKSMIKLPSKFQIELRYREYQKAYRASFFPGVKLVEPQLIRFETSDYYEVLRMLMFVW